MELAKQFACIEADEATKVKGESTWIGEQFRSLNPRVSRSLHRYADQEPAAGPV